MVKLKGASFCGEGKVKPEKKMAAACVGRRGRSAIISSKKKSEERDYRGEENYFFFNRKPSKRGGNGLPRGKRRGGNEALLDLISQKERFHGTSTLS